MSQPTIRFEPREQLSMLYETLLLCQFLEVRRILTGLGLDVVYVRLVGQNLHNM